MCDYYLPGFRAGGPIQSLSGLVSALGETFDFRIITRNRDLATKALYSETNSAAAASTRVGNAEVTYLPRRALTLRGLRLALRASPHQVLYLNSFFSPQFTIKPLILRKLRLVARNPVVVLAPRGEFSPAALALSRRKKRAFIACARIFGLYRGAIWQASTIDEGRLICQVMGARLKIRVAEVIVAGDVAEIRIAGLATRRPKAPGQLRIVMVSRITPMKNQLAALNMLGQVRGRVTFDLFGPIDDPTYMAKVREAMRRLPPNVEANYRGELPHDEVATKIGDYDLFLLPTLGENYGHIIREALSAGCPVLVSDRTPWHGLSEAGAGWDLPLETPAEFVDRLHLCVRMIESEHKLMREAAVAYAREFLERDPSLKQNRELFLGAIAMYRRRR